MWSRLVLAGGVLSSVLSPAAALWPIPRELSTGEDVLFIAQTLEITYNGGSLPYTYGFSPSPGPTCNDKEIVQGGVSRTLGAIFQNNFVPWRIRPRNSDFEPDVYADDKKWVKSLTITHDEDGDSSCYKPLAGEVDESYTFELTTNGEATIEAKTAIGVLRALETFGQLFYQHTSGTFWYTTVAPVSIKDEPKFPHRGILLDVARNWYPVKDILRTIDALSWNKMNRLHIHITDSQSWPLEIPAFPELAAKGAYRKGNTYTPADVAQIQEYGAHRGVEVILEIDMPGHIGSVSHAFPDLIVAYNEIPYQWWCAQPPCGAFKLNNTDVDDFLETLFDDLLPRVAPYSAYFHTGGDELNKNDSMLDDGVQSNATEVLQPLLQKFIDTQHGRVRKAGLTPMVWEEIPLEWNVTIGEDVVVQTWLGEESVSSLTAAGHKVIDSNYNFWYLDCGRGQWLNFDNGEAFQQFYPFNDWCGPTKSWRLIYSHDPTAGLTEEQAKKVLGGELAVWSETIDPVTLDGIVWPRASAAGEVLWSGRQDAAGQNRSQYDASPRLAEMRERMVARGVGATVISQLWCTQSDKPEECALIP